MLSDEHKKYTCIIPARYESSRFPGKPLAQIAGKPMIDWVYEHAQAATKTGRVIVATDSQLIFDHCTQQGFDVIMTKEHRNGSERVYEVAQKLGEPYVFEMQGDQPLLLPEQVDLFLAQAEQLVIKNPAIDVVHPFTEATEEQTMSPDVVKAFVTISNRILFQSRAPIPTKTRTLGLYLWKTDALGKFSSIEKSPTEIIEDTHPVRLYYNDFFVQGLPFDGSDWIEVDRPEQIAQVETLFAKRNMA